MKGTQMEFAKHIKRSKQYVSQLKLAGKLVMSGKLVDFEKSLAKLATLADPSNDPASTMPRKDGRSERSIGMKARDEAAKADTKKADAKAEAKTTTTDAQVAEQYQNSRAVREAYTARLKKLEYEREAGELVHRDGVTMASFKIARILRDKLASIPVRLAPVLTIETEQKEVYAVLNEEVQSIIKQIQSALSESRT